VTATPAKPKAVPNSRRAAAEATKAAATPAKPKAEPKPAAATDKAPHSHSKTLDEPEEAVKPAAAAPPASRRVEKMNLPPAPKSRKKEATKKDADL